MNTPVFISVMVTADALPEQYPCRMIAERAERQMLKNRPADVKITFFRLILL